MYGILKFVVVDRIGRGDDATDKISGIKVIVPSNPPRLRLPPTFEGQSFKTGVFVRVCIFRRKMSTFGSRNNNPETDVDSMSYLMQKQNEAMRRCDATRFVELSGILQRKLQNPKQIKFKVEKFVELKVNAVNNQWQWNTLYNMADLTEDPKSPNTLYPDPADVISLEEVGDFNRGFFEIEDIPEEQQRQAFSEQFQPTEKAKRQERGSAIGNLWKLVIVDAVNDLEKDPKNPTYVDAKNDFQEPEFFKKLIGHHPELAFEQLDEYYSDMYEGGEVDEGVFDYSILNRAANLVADGKEVYINCNCGRSEKSCHCTWIKNKVTEIARRVKSKQLNEKGI